MRNILDVGSINADKNWSHFHKMYDEGGKSGNKYLIGGCGYWNDANQFRFCLCIPKGADVKVAASEINSVTPLMTIIRISLNDYHSDEDNTHNLIFEDNVWAIETLVHGIEKNLIKFKTLEDALKHIQVESKEEKE